MAKVLDLDNIHVDAEFEAEHKRMSFIFYGILFLIVAVCCFLIVWNVFEYVEEKDFEKDCDTMNPSEFFTDRCVGQKECMELCVQGLKDVPG